jgi:hypothetical protein
MAASVIGAAIFSPRAVETLNNTANPDLITTTGAPSGSNLETSNINSTNFLWKNSCYTYTIVPKK